MCGTVIDEVSTTFHKQRKEAANKVLEAASSALDIINGLTADDAHADINYEAVDAILEAFTFRCVSAVEAGDRINPVALRDMLHMSVAEVMDSEGWDEVSPRAALQPVAMVGTREYSPGTPPDSSLKSAKAAPKSVKAPPLLRPSGPEHLPLGGDVASSSNAQPEHLDHSQVHVPAGNRTQPEPYHMSAEEPDSSSEDLGTFIDLLPEANPDRVQEPSNPDPSKATDEVLDNFIDHINKHVPGSGSGYMVLTHRGPEFIPASGSTQNLRSTAITFKAIPG